MEKHDYPFTFVCFPCWIMQILQHAVAQFADFTRSESCDRTVALAVFNSDCVLFFQCLRPDSLLR